MPLKELYFAYGSNLNVGQMAVRCPMAQPIETAVLEGYELAFRRGVLTILPKEGSRVEGLLWKVNTGEEWLLDHYEGYPYLYTKESLPVQTRSGPKTVIAYVMTYPGCVQVQPPNAVYLQTVLQGYRQAGFDPQAVQQALTEAIDVQTQRARRKRLDTER